MNTTKPTFIGSRLFYTICFILLFIIEVLIAKYVHDAFIRPYLGDVLVVILVYCATRIIIKKPLKWLPFAVFAFACSIETMQYFQLADRLGLEHNTIARIVLGSVFDWADIACYAVGSIFLCFIRK